MPEYHLSTAREVNKLSTKPSTATQPARNRNLHARICDQPAVDASESQPLPEEDREDLAYINERASEPRISFDTIEAELRAEALLS